MNWKELGVTINHVFRYGYGGFLSFLVAAVASPDATKKTVDALGEVLSPLIAFAIGGAIYVFFRPVIGDFLIFNFFDIIHRKLEPKWGYIKGNSGGKGYNCKYHYLEERFGVLHENRLQAFRIVRNKLFDTEMAKRFEIQHSEIFLLYLTFLVLSSSSLYLIVKQYFAGWNQVGLTVIFALISLLCLFFGIWADIFLCRDECAELMTLNSEAVGSVLHQVEFGTRQEC